MALVLEVWVLVGVTTTTLVRVLLDAEPYWVTTVGVPDAAMMEVATERVVGDEVMVVLEKVTLVVLLLLGTEVEVQLQAMTVTVLL